MKITLCQNCHKKPIEVSYTHIFNGQREDYVLCLQCAQNLEMDSRFGQFALHQETQLRPAHSHGGMTNAEIPNVEMLNVAPPSAPEPQAGINTENPSELDKVNSKILAVTLDKENAVANENYLEAARIQKILQALVAEKQKLVSSN